MDPQLSRCERASRYQRRRPPDHNAGGGVWTVRGMLCGGPHRGGVVLTELRDTARLAGGRRGVPGGGALARGWLRGAGGDGPARPGGGAARGAEPGALPPAAGTATVATAGWYTEDRFVRRQPAAALPAVGLDPPERL